MWATSTLNSGRLRHPGVCVGITLLVLFGGGVLGHFPAAWPDSHNWAELALVRQDYRLPLHMVLPITAWWSAASRS